NWIWCIVIGALIIAWILMGLKNMNRVNIFAMGALFVLTVIMSTVIFGGDGHYEFTDAITFGSAVELSVAMPLSWLPLISDYTRNAKKGKLSTFVSAAVYFFVSCWMYIIGLAGTLFTGETDVSKIMVSAGLGIASLLIIVFSTVTTTFLDVYSAGVSSVSVSKKLKEKPAALIVCVAGVLLAIFTPITQFENFLYLIGSVFAPMTAILICDYFIIKRDSSAKAFDLTAIIVWCIGFIAYRLLMNVDIPVGYTLPAMAITGIIDIAARMINLHSKKTERS
ncbi:MAG TPA: cytosine permease, partial [Bacillota bacterium]|nr:cytosine permease [Bacillota bacterium]